MSSSLKQGVGSIKHQGLKTTGKDLSSSYDKELVPSYKNQNILVEASSSDLCIMQVFLNFLSDYQQLVQFTAKLSKIPHNLPSSVKHVAINIVTLLKYRECLVMWPVPLKHFRNIKAESSSTVSTSDAAVVRRNSSQNIILCVWMRDISAWYFFGYNQPDNLKKENAITHVSKICTGLRSSNQFEILFGLMWPLTVITTPLLVLVHICSLHTSSQGIILTLCCYSVCSSPLQS